jgi:hypothetical protein
VLLAFRCFPPLPHTHTNRAGKNKEINPGWHVFLYNLTADRAETTDLWAVQRDDAKAMLGRFIQWQVSSLRCMVCMPRYALPPTRPPRARLEPSESERERAVYDV